MSAPLIGVTTYRNLNRYGFQQFSINQVYILALQSAGACPVMIPLGLPNSILEDLIARLDGVLFTGGGDLQPECYASNPHPLVSDVDQDRDWVEIRLLQHTIKRELPFLGICRGLQVINVALGGSLYEDILEQHQNANKHQYFPDWPRDYLAHPIYLSEGSQIASILCKSNLEVNSMHHQGIRRLAPGLVASAIAPDGIIEAIELSEYEFGIAVQWHPEWMTDDLAMQRIFREFVLAAGEKNAQKAFNS